MFNKIDDETKLVAVSALNLAIASPFILAAKAKAKVRKTAQQHPVATAVVAGTVGGAVLGTALVHSDKVADSSLYAKIF